MHACANTHARTHTQRHTHMHHKEASHIQKKEMRGKENWGKIRGIHYHSFLGEPLFFVTFCLFHFYCVWVSVCTCVFVAMCAAGPHVTRHDCGGQRITLGQSVLSVHDLSSWIWSWGLVQQSTYRAILPAPGPELNLDFLMSSKDFAKLNVVAWVYSISFNYLSG